MYNLEDKSTALPYFKRKRQLCILSHKVIYRFLKYRISFIGYLFIKMSERKKDYHSKKKNFLGNQYTKKVKTFSRNKTEENSASKNNENRSSSI